MSIQASGTCVIYADMHLIGRRKKIVLCVGLTNAHEQMHGFRGSVAWLSDFLDSALQCARVLEVMAVVEGMAVHGGHGSAVHGSVGGHGKFVVKRGHVYAATSSCFYTRCCVNVRFELTLLISLNKRFELTLIIYIYTVWSQPYSYISCV